MLAFLFSASLLIAGIGTLIALGYALFAGAGLPGAGSGRHRGPGAWGSGRGGGWSGGPGSGNNNGYQDLVGARAAGGEQELQRRWPTRFVPHYTMVTFMLIPYAIALQRSEIQRQILVAATQGMRSLDSVDWQAVDAQVRSRLDLLVDAA